MLKKRNVVICVDDDIWFCNGTDIAFDVSFNGSISTPSVANFTIYNPSPNQIKAIATNTGVFWNEQEPHRISCWVGYQVGDKENEYSTNGATSPDLLFSGYILKAEPANLPDVELKLYCQSDISYMSNHLSFTYENKTILFLLREAAATCRLKVYCTDYVKSHSKILQKVVKQYPANGKSSFEFLKDIRKMIGSQFTKDEYLNLSTMNGIIYVDLASSEEEYKWQVENIGRSTAIKVSAQEGNLIGLPRPTNAGMDVTMLYDRTIQPFGYIDLFSTRFPDNYNGLYKIINVRHHGRLRGNEFYTDLSCISTKQVQ